MKFGILYKTSRDQEFRENRLGDNKAWMSDVQDLLHVLSVFLERYE